MDEFQHFVGIIRQFLFQDLHNDPCQNRHRDCLDYSIIIVAVVVQPKLVPSYAVTLMMRNFAQMDLRNPVGLEICLVIRDILQVQPFCYERFGEITVCSVQQSAGEA